MKPVFCDQTQVLIIEGIVVGGPVNLYYLVLLLNIAALRAWKWDIIILYRGINILEVPIILFTLLIPLEGLLLE